MALRRRLGWLLWLALLQGDHTGLSSQDAEPIVLTKAIDSLTGDCNPGSRSCNLRAAVQLCNVEQPVSCPIALASGTTYYMTKGPINITTPTTTSITITTADDPSEDYPIINGGLQQSRLFNIFPLARLKLEYVKIVDFGSANAYFGGAIYNVGSLSMSNVISRGNEAVYGGLVFSGVFDYYALTLYPSQAPTHAPTPLPTPHSETDTMSPATSPTVLDVAEARTVSDWSTARTSHLRASTMPVGASLVDSNDGEASRLPDWTRRDWFDRWDRNANNSAVQLVISGVDCEPSERQMLDVHNASDIYAERGSSAEVLCSSACSIDGDVRVESTSCAPSMVPTPSPTPFVFSVVAPRGDASVKQGKSLKIAWECSPCPSEATVTIDLLQPHQGDGATLIASIPSSDTSFSWHVPRNEPTGSDYRVRVNLTNTAEDLLVMDETQTPIEAASKEGVTWALRALARSGAQSSRATAVIVASDESESFTILKRTSHSSLTLWQYLALGGIALAAVIVALAVWLTVRWNRMEKERQSRLAFVKRLEESGVSDHPLLEGALESMSSTPSDWILDVKSLQLGRMIGVGSSAHVFEGKYFGELVAAKRLPALSMDPLEVEAFMRKEAGILVHLHHPCIIKFYGIGLEGDYIYLVTELCRGSLKGLIDQANKNGKFLPVSRLLSFALGIARGIEYLHSRDVVHRDIKPDNVLLTDRHEVKLCDFGISRMVSDRSGMTTAVGTPLLMAPELVQSESAANANAQAVDAYSYGILLWMMWTQQLNPYEDVDNPWHLLSQVAAGRRPLLETHPRLEAMGPRFHSLIRRCWDAAPDARPSFAWISNELDAIRQETDEARRTRAAGTTPAAPTGSGETQTH